MELGPKLGGWVALLVELESELAPCHGVQFPHAAAASPALLPFFRVPSRRLDSEPIPPAHPARSVADSVADSVVVSSSKQ